MSVFARKVPGVDRATISGVKRLLFALALIAAAGPLNAADVMVHRVELVSGGTILAKTVPVVSGTRLVFGRYPDGALLSVRRSEVRRVVGAPVRGANALAVRDLKPGELLVLGPTGEGSSAARAGAAPEEPRPGEARGGRAMFNPSRDYRPEWDARQVPGASLAYPASPGDYREGATLAYPPGSAAQSAPGQPPTGVPTGQPPKSPQ